MRVLVISDIHANLAAFEAVLEDAHGLWEQLWFLGDLVGYGPNPNECVRRLKEMDHVSLSGNHDWAALQKLTIDEFNEDARAAMEWTRAALTAESRAFLDSLPPSYVLDAFTLAHASPRQPVWEYVLDYETAAANFAHFDTPCCLVGHTHIPFFVSGSDGTDIEATAVAYEEPFALQGSRFMINPGSVGQPRDGDPRAAYALLDTEKMVWQFCRTPYPIEITQRRMHELGLPAPLAERLSYGW